MAEPRGEGGMSRALNAAWLRPFLFLIFIVVAWDLAIRVFRIPAYQIPAPADVVTVLWQDWPELARQSWPTTYATIWGFVLSPAAELSYLAAVVLDRRIACSRMLIARQAVPLV